MATSLSQYMHLFVWRISSAQILLITLAVFAGLFVGVPWRRSWPSGWRRRHWSWAA